MKRVSSKTVGVLLALLAVALFSSKAVVVKVLYGYHVSTIHMLLLRMLFAIPFYLMIWYLDKRKPTYNIEKKDYLWLVVFGVMGYYGASFFDFYGLKYLTASLERVILFVYPTLVVLINAIVFKKKVTKTQLLAIGITYIGIFFTLGGELQANENSHILLGAGLIFMSALTYAGYLAGSDWLIPKFGTTKFTSMAMVVACASVFLHYLITDANYLWGYDPEVYVWTIGMSIFCTVVPSYLVSYAITKLGSSNFSIVASIGPVFTIVLAMILLGESITLVQWIGVTVVILGVRLVAKK